MMLDPQPFAGKVALLTGSAGHLAGTTARLLAERGATIAAVDRAGSDFSALSDAIPADRLLVLEADVRDPAQVEAYVNATLERFGRIDVFFNAAGVAGPVHPIVDYPVDDFALVMDVNVKGVFLGLKYVIAAMVAGGGGVIVNAASLAGLRCSKGVNAYTASKHAVVALTKVAANEYGNHGVRVCAIAPGPIESPMLDEHLLHKTNELEQARAVAAAAIPVGRLGTASDVAKLVAFLASDEAAYLNGIIVPVDGGLGAG